MSLADDDLEFLRTLDDKALDKEQRAALMQEQDQRSKLWVATWLDDCMAITQHGIRAVNLFDNGFASNKDKDFFWTLWRSNERVGEFLVGRSLSLPMVSGNTFAYISQWLDNAVDLVQLAKRAGEFPCTQDDTLGLIRFITDQARNGRALSANAAWLIEQLETKKLRSLFLADMTANCDCNNCDTCGECGWSYAECNCNDESDDE